MIRTNDALLRQAREFFAANFAGRFSLTLLPPEENPEVDGRRMLFADKTVPADSRFREMVRVTFCGWELILVSSAERPPMGELVLRSQNLPGAPVVVGPLDAATWQKIRDEIVKTSNATKEREHAYR